MNITFTHPGYLLWLPVVLAAAGALWYLTCMSRRVLRDRYGEDELLSRFTRKESRRDQLAQLAAWLTIATAIMVALAAPVRPDQPRTVAAGTLQVVCVLDVSRSMGSEDYRHTMPLRDGSAPSAVVGPHGSRLEMAKWTINSQIAPCIRGNKLGIVTFVGDGFCQVPLTDDYVSTRWVSDNWITILSAPGSPKADFVAGLKEALATFARAKDKNMGKVILLFSDGGWTQNEAELEKVASQLKEQNIHLLMVGVGNTEPQRIPVYNNNERTGWYQLQGKDCYTALEEDGLKKLANLAGGDYLCLGPDTLLPVDWARKLGGSKAEVGQIELSHYPSLLALSVLFLLSLRGLFRKSDVSI